VKEYSNNPKAIN